MGTRIDDGIDEMNYFNDERQTLRCHSRGFNDRFIFPLALTTFHTVSAIMNREALYHERVSTLPPFRKWSLGRHTHLFDIPLYRSNETSLHRAYFYLYPISFFYFFFLTQSWLV